MRTRIHLSTTLAATAALALAACGGDQPLLLAGQGEQALGNWIDAESNELMGPAPFELIDHRGVSHRLVGRAESSEVAVDPTGRPIIEDAGEVVEDDRETLTVEQLAYDLRGVTLVGGYEYRQTEPAWELARAILDRRGEPAETVSSFLIENEKVGEEETRIAKGIIGGTDSRSVRRNNTSFPWRAMTHSDIGCTGTLVSPTTIVTAAHCVYNTDNNTWLKVGGNWPKYGRGADAGDATTYPYGQFTCYSVTVPGGWVDGNNVRYDYAVLQLNCSQSTTSWMGTWTASESTIEDSSTYLYGYPGDKSPYPQIWGMGLTSGGTYINWWETYRLRHSIDTAGGQSGSAIYLFNGSGNRRLIGIHKGQSGSLNHGKRWDSTVYDFTNTYSRFPEDI